MSEASEPRILDFSSWKVWLVLALIVLSKAPVFFQTHEENDEVIYTLLARNVVESGHYTIPPDAPERLLDNPRYNRPLFYHPPLYVWLLTPFVWMGWAGGGVIVSLAGHVLCLLAIWIFIREWCLAGGHCRRVAAICLLAAAFDPILSSISARLWMDNVLAGLVSLSLCLSFVAARKRSVALWTVCGVLGGLACVTKLSAVVVLWFPVLVLAVQPGPLRTKVKPLFALLIPTAAIMGAWLGYFYHVYGVFLPDWVAPGPADDNAFIRMIRSRPFHYYLVALLSFQPLLLLALVGILPKAFRWRKDLLMAIALVPACFLPFISWMSARELGFMSRHLAIAIPSLYCCLFLWLGRPALWTGGRRLFVQACLALGIVQGILFQTVACHGDIPAFLYKLFAGATAG